MRRRHVLGALAFLLVVGLAAVALVVVTRPSDEGAPVGVLSLPGEPPDRDAVAVTADGRLLYLATEDGLAVLDVAADEPVLLRTIPMRDRPRHLALAPDGLRVFAATAAGLTVVDLATNLVTATVAVRGGLDGMTVAPDGKRLYAPSFLADGVVVLDAVNPSVVATVPVPEYTQGPVVTSADGRAVFAPVFRGVAVLDAAPAVPSVAGYVEVGPSLRLMTSADRALLYAPSATSALVVLDTATHTVLRRVSGTADAGLQVAGPGTLLCTLAGSELSSVDMAVGAPGRSRALDLDGRAATAVAVAGDGRAFVVVPDTARGRPGLRLMVFGAP